MGLKIQMAFNVIRFSDTASDGGIVCSIRKACHCNNKKRMI